MNDRLTKSDIEKMQQEIDKLKRKHKRQIIKKSIEEQRKKD